MLGLKNAFYLLEQGLGLGTWDVCDDLWHGRLLGRQSGHQSDGSSGQWSRPQNNWIYTRITVLKRQHGSSLVLTTEYTVVQVTTIWSQKMFGGGKSVTCPAPSGGMIHPKTGDNNLISTYVWRWHSGKLLAPAVGIIHPKKSNNNLISEEVWRWRVG